jgi:hypothetical protein
MWRIQAGAGGLGVWSAETVFACALALLGRSEQAFPPVEFVDYPPVGVSASAQAYVRTPEARIVVITSTEAFTNARRTLYRCTDITAIREIAGVLAHEEWHVRHGPDEESAYNAQLTTLLAIGAGYGSPAYYKVLRAKLAVGAASRRNARAPMVARDGQ